MSGPALPRAGPAQRFGGGDARLDRMGADPDIRDGTGRARYRFTLSSPAAVVGGP